MIKLQNLAGGPQSQQHHQLRWITGGSTNNPRQSNHSMTSVAAEVGPASVGSTGLATNSIFFCFLLVKNH